MYMIIIKFQRRIQNMKAKRIFTCFLAAAILAISTFSVSAQVYHGTYKGSNTTLTKTKNGYQVMGNNVIYTQEAFAKGIIKSGPPSYVKVELFACEGYGDSATIYYIGESEGNSDAYLDDIKPYRNYTGCRSYHTFVSEDNTYFKLDSGCFNPNW